MPKRRRVEKKTLLEIFVRNRDKLVIPRSFRIAPKSDPVWLKICEDLNNAVTPSNAHAMACRMDFPKLANDTRSPELLFDQQAKRRPTWENLYRAMIQRRNTVLVTKPPTLVSLKDPVWTSIAGQVDNAYTVKTIRFMAASDPAFRDVLLSDEHTVNSTIVKLERDQSQAEDITSRDAIFKLLRTTDSLATDVKFLKKTEKFSRKILSEIRNLRVELLTKNF